MQTAMNKTIVTPDSVTFHFQYTLPVVALFVRKQSLKKSYKL